LDSLDIDSKFRLAILAAKRAKQLVHGAKKKVDIDAENPLTVAIEEINQGKINFHILEEDEMLQQQLFLRKEDDEDEISDEDLLEGLKDMMGPREDDDEDEDEEEDEEEDDDDDSEDEDDDDVDEDEIDEEDEDDEE